MPDGDQSKDKGSSVNVSDASAESSDASVDSPEKDKAVALSELLGNLLVGIKQLKEFSLSKAELEKVGIASSFHDLPCTFDICLTKETGTNEETTRIRRELKHILLPSRVQGGEACSVERYQTYVDVGIEHYEKPAKWVSTFWKAVRWVLAAVIMLLAVVGVVSFANRLSPPRQKTEISNNVVRQFDGTNLTQKVEMSVKCEERGR